jgi:ammonia channel protein AmtB
MFMFIWTTLIYDPVAYWIWGARGWIRNMSCLNTLTCQIGGIDFAGMILLGYNRRWGCSYNVWFFGPWLRVYAWQTRNPQPTSWGPPY